MPEFDLVIRGGTVVDGTTVPRFTADVAIHNGRIAEIGRIDATRGSRVLDADGLIVAPGFVDLHTHYDAQIQWDPWCSISGWHGVTSVALGNCGFGFAPVHPEERDRAMLTMSRTEAIPFESMKAGMLWDWETFPEWMNTLERVPKGVNCLTYAPLAPLMIYAMGLDAAKSRPANDSERAQMRELMTRALDAGACGWSCQRLGSNSIQSDYDGSPMVTDTMAEEDLLMFAEVLGQRSGGRGIIQITQASHQAEGEAAKDFELVEKLAEISGATVLYNVVLAVNGSPAVHQMFIEWLRGCHERGHQVYGQANSIRAPFAFSLDEWNLFDTSPAWNRALTGTLEDKKAKLQDARLRAEMIADVDNGKLPTVVLGGRIEGYIFQGSTNAPQLDHLIGQTLGDIAKDMAVHPVDAMVELSLASELKASFLTKSATSDDPEYVSELLSSPVVFPGVSDGGAHTKFLTAGSYTTDTLMWLVRDEQRMTLEQAHYKLSYLPARAAGFKNRGALVEGAPADVVVYDLDQLARLPDWWDSEITHDFPAGEWRRVQHARGYHYILVNGEITFEQDKCTGATPGMLLRHGLG